MTHLVMRPVLIAYITRILMMELVLYTQFRLADEADVTGSLAIENTVARSVQEVAEGCGN